MAFFKCRLCGHVFVNEGRGGFCPSCIRRLDDLYIEVHKYMRDHAGEDFDMYKLADSLETSAADIQALIDLGYIERDISLYGTRSTNRSRLAEELSAAMERMGKEKITTYGGSLYSRGSASGDNSNTGRRK